MKVSAFPAWVDSDAGQSNMLVSGKGQRLLLCPKLGDMLLFTAHNTDLSKLSIQIILQRRLFSLGLCLFCFYLFELGV